MMKILHSRGAGGNWGFSLDACLQSKISGTRKRGRHISCTLGRNGAPRFMRVSGARSTSLPRHPRMSILTLLRLAGRLHLMREHALPSHAHLSSVRQQYRYFFCNVWYEDESLLYPPRSLVRSNGPGKIILWTPENTTLAHRTGRAEYT